MKSIKELRKCAEETVKAGVTNKASFYAAVPLLTELQNVIVSFNQTIKCCKELANDLSNVCSTYALDHQSVFDDGLLLIAKGVKSGDVTIDGTTYHFSSGYDTYKRLNGDALSKEFLEGLPKGWTKTKTELSTTGINNSKPSDEELAAAGLYRPEKYTWK